MSRALHVLHDVYETLHIMAGEMNANSDSFFSESTSDGIFAETQNDSSMARPSIPSISEHCKNRDAARGITLRSSHAKHLAYKLAKSLKDRLGNICNVLSATSTLWRHKDDTDTP